MENKLRGLLQQLQDELERAESVEPESRDLLRDVMADIEGTLERSTKGEATVADNSAKERLDQAVVEFENSHPQLSYTLERLMDSLAAMGI